MDLASTNSAATFAYDKGKDDASWIKQSSPSGLGGWQPFVNAIGNGVSKFAKGIVPGSDTLVSNVNKALEKGDIKYTESGIPYDSSNIDSQINALAQEVAYKRDDESYDRLVAALRRNGINPALALGNAAPMSSDTAYRSSYNMTTKDQVNSAAKIMAIMAIVFKLLA